MWLRHFSENSDPNILLEKQRLDYPVVKETLKSPDESVSPTG